MKKLVVVGMIVVALVLLGGCFTEKAKEPFRDAPQSKIRNTHASDIIEMPDGFSNLASKCDGPNRIYVAFKADANRASISVVKDDPRCLNR